MPATIDVTTSATVEQIDVLSGHLYRDGISIGTLEAGYPGGSYEASGVDTPLPLPTFVDFFSPNYVDTRLAAGLPFGIFLNGGFAVGPVELLDGSLYALDHELFCVTSP